MVFRLDRSRCVHCPVQIQGGYSSSYWRLRLSGYGLLLIAVKGHTGAILEFMKNSIFTITGISLAFIFWFFDSFIHYFLYGEPEFEIFPEEFNELWMRIVIVSLIMLFGVFSDHFSRRLVIKEKSLEALHIYNSMIHATHHILNNLLNQMQIIRLEALKSKDFNQNIIKDYDSAINEAVDLLNKLSSVKKITDKDIWASVDPKNIVVISTKAHSGENKRRATD